MKRLVRHHIGVPQQIPQPKNIDVELSGRSTVWNRPANRSELQNLNGRIQLKAEGSWPRTRWSGVKVEKRNQGKPVPDPGASKIGEWPQAISDTGERQTGAGVDKHIGYNG
jgi:hypothetical protein